MCVFERERKKETIFLGVCVCKNVDQCLVHGGL